MKHRELNGHTTYFNLTIHRDMLKEVKKRAIDSDLSTSHYICDIIEKELRGDLVGTNIRKVKQN